MGLKNFSRWQGGNHFSRTDFAILVPINKMLISCMDMEKYAEPEEISREEVEVDTGFMIFFY